MKKFLLIALISGSAFAANAQSSFGRHDDNDRNRQPVPLERGSDQHMNRQHDLDNRIAAINNDYNNRINGLKHEPMRGRERRRQVKQLERERTVALQNCRDNFSRDFGSSKHTHRF